MKNKKFIKIERELTLTEKKNNSPKFNKNWW